MLIGRSCRSCRYIALFRSTAARCVPGSPTNGGSCPAQKQQHGPDPEPRANPSIRGEAGRGRIQNWRTQFGPELAPQFVTSLGASPGFILPCRTFFSITWRRKGCVEKTGITVPCARACGTPTTSCAYSPCLARPFCVRTEDRRAAEGTGTGGPDRATDGAAGRPAARPIQYLRRHSTRRTLAGRGTLFLVLSRVRRWLAASGH